MAKRKAKRAPAKKPAKSNGGLLSSLAGNRLLMIGLLGVIAIVGLVLMLLNT